MKIYIVVAVYDYETSNIITSFKNKEDAERLVSECEEYEVFISPDLDGSVENWEKFQECRNEWERKFPGGSESGADSYSVIESELV